jgi:hypothetical protein
MVTMHLLENIYNEVHARGLVASRRGFSREFLGKAHNYATAGKTRNRPSPDALVSLARRLVEVGASDLAQRVMGNLLAADDRAGPRA